MATISHITDRSKNDAIRACLGAPAVFDASACAVFDKNSQLGLMLAAARAVGVVGGQHAVVASFKAATKKGQLLLAIGLFGNLVAGTGFEPVTFGL